VDPAPTSDEPLEADGTDWGGLGMRLRLARKLARMTQGEFGERVGRGKAAVSLYERGDRAVPPEVVAVAGQVFGVTQGWLLHGEGDGPGARVAPTREVRPRQEPGSARTSEPTDEPRILSARAGIPANIQSQWVACPHCSTTEPRRRDLPTHFLSGNCVQSWEDGDLLAMTLEAPVDPEPWELALVEAQKKIERSRAMIKASGLNLRKRNAWKKAYELNLQLLETIDHNGPENYRQSHPRLEGGLF
jgi:transcriptional regulator with XRE-family HTH domain